MIDARKWCCLVGLPLTLTLSACADRQGSIDAALALTQSVYPGQLELLETHMKKDHYDVTFAVKGDAVTRIRFAVDRIPARCVVGTRCEDRLRRAYASGMEAGVKLKAIAASLPACGAAVLAVDGTSITPTFRTIVELHLDPGNQQPGLDTLAPCITAFRAALPSDASPQQRTLALRILLPEPGKPAPAHAPVGFDTQLARKRSAQPSYLIAANPDESRLEAEKLRLYTNYLSVSEVRNRLADHARKILKAQGLSGHIQKFAEVRGTRLDPQRLDVLRTYVLFCSKAEANQGPCQTDRAIRMRYDIKTGEASEIAILDQIRGERGSLLLPALPGR